VGPASRAVRYGSPAQLVSEESGSGAPGGIRTHTVDILSVLPLPIGLRGRQAPTDISTSIGTCLSVAVRAQQRKVLQPVVGVSTVDMLQLQGYGLSPPQRSPASFANRLLEALPEKPLLEVR
jgi:hypothetical protein